jgi:hypothetical protein
LEAVFKFLDFPPDDVRSSQPACYLVLMHEIVEPSASRRARSRRAVPRVGAGSQPIGSARPLNYTTAVIPCGAQSLSLVPRTAVGGCYEVGGDHI